jgi:hypothetical protein
MAANFARLPEPLPACVAGTPHAVSAFLTAVMLASETLLFLTRLIAWMS